MILSYLEHIESVTISFMPCALLTEADEGPDQNITFLWSWLAAVALWLQGNIDCKIFTRGFPSISFLCTSKRSMGLLDIGLVGCGFVVYEIMAKSITSGANITSQLYTPVHMQDKIVNMYTY